jgi:hypothetical protein
MIKGFMSQQEQQSLVVEENMSNLTSASGEASANSSGNRTEVDAKFSQEYFASSQTQTHDETPAKKRRNLPGNPGSFS